MCGPGDEDDDDVIDEDAERERLEDELENWYMDNDPYSDDEKEQMGSSEFFFPDD